MRDKHELVEDNGEYALVKVKSGDLPRLRIQKESHEIVLESYIEKGFPKKAYHRYRDKQGNVVLAFTNSCFLMLDCDIKRKEEVIEFSREYSKLHNLGSSAVWKTSDSSQVDLFGNPLANYCVIFGKILSWDEIKWHVQEAYRLGMVNKGFVIIRKFGSITIRVNSKNDKIPPPMPIAYFSNGGKKARKGVIAFIRHWVMCRELG
jgi:hypothetical protein